MNKYCICKNYQGFHIPIKGLVLCNTCLKPILKNQRHKETTIIKEIKMFLIYILVVTIFALGIFVIIVAMLEPNTPFNQCMFCI